LVVVVVQVARDGPAGLRPGGERAVAGEQLELDRGVERLGHRVVEGGSGVAHGLGDLGVGAGMANRCPVAAYRRFHPITVGLDTPTCSTMSFTGTSSAASSTILARWARPARTDDERVHDCNTSRSADGTSTVTVNAMTHRPQEPRP
jgi:hypothetical protein